MPNLTCMSGWHYTNLDVNLREPGRYSLSDTAAHAAIDAVLETQILANNAFYNLDGRHMTGRLRISLWAIPANGQIGKHGVVGHLIARAPARMVGGQGPDGDRLWQVSTASLRLETRGTNPPPGQYCIAMTAEEETATGTPPCLTQDRYCITGWHAFRDPLTFR